MISIRWSSNAVECVERVAKMEIVASRDPDRDVTGHRTRARGNANDVDGDDADDDDADDASGGEARHRSCSRCRASDEARARWRARAGDARRQGRAEEAHEGE